MSKKRTLGPGLASAPTSFAYRQNKINSSNNYNWDFIDEEDPVSRRDAQNVNYEGGIGNLFGIESFNGFQVRFYP